MNVSRRRSIGLAVAGVAGTQLRLAPSPYAAAGARQNDAEGSVSWEGLGTTTKIVGRLGKPLGELLRVVGTTVDAAYVRDKGQEDDVLLRVASVDGDELKDPPVIPLSFFSFLGIDQQIPSSTKLSLLGYEGGNFRGIPRAAMEHFGKDGGVVPATQGWHFATHFTVLENFDAPVKPRRRAKPAPKK